MYRRPKFLEILLEIRREMAHEADYDVDLFTEIARSGVRPHVSTGRNFPRAPKAKEISGNVICELTPSKDV